MKEVSLGKTFDPSGDFKPQNMPGIRLYVTLLYHFGNITEASNINLVSSVLEVMASADTANVYEITDKFDKAVDPVASTFTKVDDFMDYFKASLQYEVIRKKAKAKGAVGRAWRKAYDALRANISTGDRLSLSLSLNLLSASLKPIYASAHLPPRTGPKRLQLQLKNPRNLERSAGTTPHAKIVRRSESSRPNWPRQRANQQTPSRGTLLNPMPPEHQEEKGVRAIRAVARTARRSTAQHAVRGTGESASKTASRSAKSDSRQIARS